MAKVLFFISKLDELDELLTHFELITLFNW